MSNWGTWSSRSLGPRLYHQPRSDGTTLLGWTDQSGNGHVSVISGSSLTNLKSFSGRRVKGLVAHDDGSYAVMLWNEATETIVLAKFLANGTAAWPETVLDDSLTEFDDWVGDARLGHGGGYYGAYYSVYGTGSWMAGHHGDQLRFVTDAGAAAGGGWQWGCSHSMAELITYDADLGGFDVLCSSDAYPSKGLIRNGSTRLIAADGNEGGLVSLQLGQMAAGDDEWKAVFNAMDTDCCDGYGVGFVRYGGAAGTVVQWLTATDGSTERDPVMARLPDDSPSGEERYLVGWKTVNDSDFHLAIVSGTGAFVEGPESVGSAGIQWGERDDSMRTRSDGSVSWVDGAANGSTLTVYVYQGASIFGDGFESGTTDGWSGVTP